MGKKKTAFQIKDYQGADLMVASIGAMRRDLVRIQTAMSGDLAAIKTAYETQATPIAENIDDGVSSLEAWCDAHRKELCPPGVKTHRFPSGEVSWRQRPPRVKVKGKLETIIEWIRAYGPPVFLRHRTELNKEAMLEIPAEAEKIPGVSIRRDGEDFSVDPFDAKLSPREVA